VAALLPMFATVIRGFGMCNVMCVLILWASEATGKILTSGDSLEKQLIICHKHFRTNNKELCFMILYLRLTLFPPLAS
jgi:hypothetical protein